VERPANSSAVWSRGWPSYGVRHLDIPPPVASGHGTAGTQFLCDLLQPDHGADRHLGGVGPCGRHVLEPVAGIAVQRLGWFPRTDVHDLRCVDPVRPTVGQEHGISERRVQRVVEWVEVRRAEHSEAGEPDGTGPHEGLPIRSEALVGTSRLDGRGKPIRSGAKCLDGGPVDHSLDHHPTVLVVGVEDRRHRSNSRQPRQRWRTHGLTAPFSPRAASTVRRGFSWSIVVTRCSRAPVGEAMARSKAGANPSVLVTRSACMP